MKELERTIKRIQEASKVMADCSNAMNKEMDDLLELMKANGIAAPLILSEVGENTFIDVGGFSFYTEDGKNPHDFVVTYAPDLKMIFVNQEVGGCITDKYVYQHALPFIKEMLECVCARGRCTIFADSENEYNKEKTMRDYLIDMVAYTLETILLYNHFNKEKISNAKVVPAEFYKKKYIKEGDLSGNSGASDSAGVPCGEQRDL